MLGQPTVGVGMGASAQEQLFEMFFFATCYLMTPERVMRQPNLLAELTLNEWSTGAAGFATEQAGDLAIHASQWLELHLPRWVFRPEVEQMITWVNSTVPPFDRLPPP